MKYVEKIKAQRTEKEMLEKCKFEVQNQALKNKEFKMNAIMQLKGLSVLDKTEKLKTKELAKKLVGEIDIEDIFKDDKKVSVKKDKYDQ